jgi:alkylation response protein AidB-like acyl-CoA dehydrogenase
VAYAKHRTLWEKPIGEFQLIQLKLAQMEVARVNVRNMVFAHIERSLNGAVPTFAEASAMKLYAAQAACQVADDAIQIFGGNGYISEYRVEQLSRDARVLRIYAGTDEMQVVAIAKDLLRS